MNINICIMPQSSVRYATRPNVSLCIFIVGTVSILLQINLELVQLVRISHLTERPYYFQFPKNVQTIGFTEQQRTLELNDKGNHNALRLDVPN